MAPVLLKLQVGGGGTSVFPPVQHWIILGNITKVDYYKKEKFLNIKFNPRV